MLPIDHIYMSILTLIIGQITLKTSQYCKILFTNLSIASQPNISRKLNNLTQSKTFRKAEIEYSFYLYIILPATTLSLITTLTIWTLASLNQTIPQIPLILATILISTTITKSLTSNLHPTWLHNWTILLLNTQDELYIESLQQQLNEIHNTLTNIIKGNISLTEPELTQLKCKGLTLAKQTSELTQQHELNKQIRQLIED